MIVDVRSILSSMRRSAAVQAKRMERTSSCDGPDALVPWRPDRGITRASSALTGLGEIYYFAVSFMMAVPMAGDVKNAERSSRSSSPIRRDAADLTEELVAGRELAGFGRSPGARGGGRSI